MIIIGIIMLLISIIKLLVLIPSMDNLDDTIINNDIIDNKKAKTLLQWIFAFDGMIELLGALFIIFIV